MKPRHNKDLSEILDYYGIKTVRVMSVCVGYCTLYGKELDTDRAKPRMDQYFQQMSKIANDKRTSARVRYMLQAVMVNRSNKWISRCSENIPKTITQIHKEFAQERQEEALLSQQFKQHQESWNYERLSRRLQIWC
ncbi:eukaryotic translation initiation factor 4 gamma 1-like [Mya arenaria]|uniref:eukaryotic translation initiation factor 4 gamma 1-like n=1 Tax=Mya arenaria TaxID=6604 RepID=UPI0022DFB378|nr:eukaryotic translation initiation factor 4 gamma 1-like [Mya arenaria]XP_052760420.1 eukaryotic translation initiation factor 4 gamma 1-like [Mya arenaria]XP_052760421.1 eukaryotic translation initiation factor 4 gamma 1-like [Mya arenaria]XP_052760422.1 eukaryotic translation initiation factor 4 gamma 1-like [Mya arenaria]